MRFFKKKSKKLKKIQKNSKKFKKNLNNLKNFHNFSGGAAAGGGMPQDIAAEVSNIIKVSLKIGYVFPKILLHILNFICFSIFYRFYR